MTSATTSKTVRRIPGAILRRAVLVLPAVWLSLSTGCTGPRSVTRPSSPVDALRFDIDQVLQDSAFIQARASIKIVSLDRNEVLYERDSKMLMRPASNTKLITSAAALQILGPEYRFHTVLYADSLDPVGTVWGNLSFKGFGDPDLQVAEIDSLVHRLKAIGIKRISGNIVADASYFDDLYWGEGWMWDDEPFSDEAAISALSVNKNCVEVSAVPGKLPGEPVEVTIEPATSYVTVLNTAITVADTALQPLVITRLYKDRLNTIAIRGEAVAASDTVRESVTVWRPELFAAHLLKERLLQDSIGVTGQPVIGITLPWAHELAALSRPLDTMLINLNKVSDNLSAELTLKAISVMRGGVPGSAKHGLFQVHQVMASMGIDTTLYYVVDGSGVSHYNLVTTEMLVQLLVAMSKRPDVFPLFYKSLPIAGVDGTLEKRMKGTRAEGNLRAKTGSISGVSSLSGYVTTLEGERLALSMMMQNFILPTRLYREAQDRIGAILASFHRGGTGTALR